MLAGRNLQVFLHAPFYKRKERAFPFIFSFHGFVVVFCSCFPAVFFVLLFLILCSSFGI